MTRRAGGARVLAELSLLAVSLTAGVGALRLTQSPGETRALVAIVSCVMAGHAAVLVVTWPRRSRAGPASPAGPAGLDNRGSPTSPGLLVTGSGAGALAVALVAAWVLLWPATRVGIPTPSTVRVAWSWFAEAGTVIAAGPTPVPATTGIVLCLALGAGALAVAGRILWAWQLAATGRRRPLVVLVPAFGYFGYCALLSSDRGRVPATVVLVIAALAFTAAADRAVDAGRVLGAGVPAGAPGPATARTVSAGQRRQRPTLPAGIGAVVGAVVAALALVAATAPALASLRVDAFPQAGTGPDGTGPGAADVGTVALLDSLAATAAPDDKTVLFTARTPVPTYWQVAYLTNFDGVDWTAEASTLDVALPEPSGPTYRASVQVAGLRTTLLPAPPGTERVAGDGGLRFTGGGNVESDAFSSAGTRYTVLARFPGASAGGPALGTPGYTGVSTAALAPYLALPAVQPQVVALARRIVAGAPGPLAEADALVRWFDSGRYRYSTDPPPTTAADPLSGFLFDTRSGFCQQFAGAFAALARAVGLPSRVAVGFGAGSTGRDGVVTVRATDAHAWPQVYFGPAVGWLSFEPTPGGTATPTSVRQGKTTTATTDPVKPRPSGATTVPGLGSALAGLVPGGSSRPHPLHAAPSGSVLVPVLLAAALVAVSAGVLLWVRPVRGRVFGALRRLGDGAGAARRRARRRRGRAVPTAEVLAAWHRSAAALERASCGRRPSETPNEHAARLGAAVEQRRRLTPLVAGAYGPVPAVDAEGYRELAALATRAVYGLDGLSQADALRAERLDGEVRARLQGRGARTAVPV